MCDFMPGYVATFCNAHLDKIPEKIIVIGRDDGKVYSTFDDKEALFTKLRARKRRMPMMCYYRRGIDFTNREMESMWSHGVMLVNEAQKQHIVQTATDSEF